MKRTIQMIGLGTAAAALLAGTALATADQASAKADPVHHASYHVVNRQACVRYGPANGKDATGNVILWDWNNAPCPAGTYTIELAQLVKDKPPAPAPTPSPSVSTTSPAPVESTTTAP